METSDVISCAALVISMLTLTFLLFQEYRELFTIYWFSEYDFVFIPVNCDETSKPIEFIEHYKKEFAKSLSVCNFNRQWIGRLNQVYYHQSLDERFHSFSDLSYRSLFISSDECKYFVRIVRTHHCKKSLKQRIKAIK